MKKTIKRTITILAAATTLLVSGASMAANAAPKRTYCYNGHNHCCCSGLGTRVKWGHTYTYSKCCGCDLWYE